MARTRYDGFPTTVACPDCGRAIFAPAWNGTVTSLLDRHRRECEANKPENSTQPR